MCASNPTMSPWWSSRPGPAPPPPPGRPSPGTSTSSAPPTGKATSRSPPATATTPATSNAASTSSTKPAAASDWTADGPPSPPPRRPPLPPPPADPPMTGERRIYELLESYGFDHDAIDFAARMLAAGATPDQIVDALPHFFTKADTMPPEDIRASEPDPTRGVDDLDRYDTSTAATRAA